MTDTQEAPIPEHLLPEYVMPCFMCQGRGEYLQTYTAGCGGGYYKSMGRCDVCGEPGQWKGVGYIYKVTHKPVGQSVIAQIRAALSATASTGQMA